MTKHIIVCADDYAQNIDISEGILRLGHQNKINAISCLVNGSLWKDMHQELNDLQKTQYIGLHFNVTFGNALSSEWITHHGPSFSSIGSLLKKSYKKTLSPIAIEAEIHAQLDAFTQATGFFPDFIDGHQHVHQLPQIREVWLRLYAQHQWPSFMRHTYNGWRDFFALTGYPKQPLLALLGGMTFRQSLIKHSIPTHTSFSGIYNFKNSRHYNRYFKHFLNKSEDGGLIMCHPGESSTDVSDPLYRHRQDELTYFLSENWAHDLKQASCQLARKGYSHE